MEETNKRVVTSAIEGMSVTEVRKCLDFMRKRFREKDVATPFLISESLPCTSVAMDEFAVSFVMGHHFKRHNKHSKEK